MEKEIRMNNIARIRATYITRKVQESEGRWLDVINEEVKKIKGYSLTDQSIENNQTNTFNDIIAPGENIDNGQVISDETGEVLRDLI